MDASMKNRATDTHLVEQRGHAFRVTNDPLMLAAAGEFVSGFEEGTLQFFDAVLPDCVRSIDFGAYVGFTALYAATMVPDVFAFEPSPVNYAMLAANVGCNSDLASRIHLFSHGVADRDDEVILYAKAFGDSGSSIFQTVERREVISAAPSASVTLRRADAVLLEVGIDEHTLIKVDIEGAEYLVLPKIAELLRERKPYLHISFHPFNIVVGDDDYSNAVTRIRCAMGVAEAVAAYRFMHVFSQGRWVCIRGTDRMDFLRKYLLCPKDVPRVGTPQFGFTDAVGFSDQPLAGLMEE
jgi:FkbM family methyltransferase